MSLRTFFAELKLYICNHVIASTPSNTVRLWYYRKVMRFEIGKGSAIHLGCTFDAARQFKMGENSTINANCRIDTRGGVSIADNVSISGDVIILTADHDMDNNMEGRNLPVTIESYVWIGTRATILPGVKVEYGAVVAAGALATKNVMANAVVAGVPAKKIKERKADQLSYSASYRRLFS